MHEDALIMPHCPSCHTVLRDDPRGLACESCKVVFSELRDLIRIGDIGAGVRRRS